MLVRVDQLQRHLEGGLRSLYTLYGDEALLIQEACDQLRAAAKSAGYGDRQVHTVAAQGTDWSAILGGAMAMSLFSDKQWIELHVPSGKPGKEGSEGLQTYCQRVADNPDVLTLVILPGLDRSQTSSAWFTALEANGVMVKVDAIERAQLPAWIAKRLASHGLKVEEGEAGQQTLAFFSQRVEGNLLAAQQEVDKLALLHPPGVLTLADLEREVSKVARFDVFKFTEAVLSADVERMRRMLAGLEAEGEAAVLVHWTLAEDLRQLRRVKEATARGLALPMALRDARVWGLKERLYERALPRLSTQGLAHLLEAAQVCDGIVKGLPHAEWPREPWQAIERLALMVMTLVQGPEALAKGRLVLRTRR